MYGNGDAAKMAQAWTDAQQQMWQGWLELMQSTPAAGVAQWQKLAEQNMQAWLDNADPTARRAAEQLVNSQQAAVKFLQMAASAWEEIAKQMADGNEWRAALDDYSRRMAAEMNAGVTQWANMMQAAAQAPDAWQPYTQPWTHLWQQTAAQWQQPGFAPSFGALGDVVSRTFDVYQQTFGRFLDTPPLGYAREYEEKVRRLTKVMQEFAVANVEYQAVMTDAWVNGLTKLMEALVARAQAGKPIRTFQELSAEWADIADPAFYEVFVGEKYVRAQGKLLTATMNYRIAQREFVEIMAKQLDMPTRTEVDAAHKSIYTQRRELRALKHALAEANARIAKLETALAEQPVVAPAPAEAVAPAASDNGAAQKAASKSSTSKPAPKKPSTRKSTTGRSTKSRTSKQESED
ncbi:MAG: class III poly(R)-hydroxyalkanoic acid synthase subunit PhaE [Caldilineaceae bacterium]|nr:class III poly(R)-hydroxyalkanoic acid synthase subunit PhaE [Caldilineaceae bacterium]